MKKTLALLLVASLLLAGCTELAESDDGETLKIEVNEDIAIEEIKDFITVDEDESFGITMMYDIDPAMMEMGDMLEVEEDSEAMITMEMTQAWSPDGYHMSEIMGLTNGDASMKMISTMTHVDTTMYIEIGYETQGDLCADEETEEDIAMCEMMFGNMPAVQSYSMTTTTTHTDVIAAMADETQDNSDDMDPMAMLEFLSFVECSGSFTPADSVDGLQMFDVSMEGMNDDTLAPEMALCLADTDGSGGVSFEEFMSVDETDQEDMTAMQTAFDEADTNADDELTVDELAAFIEAVDTYYGDDDEYEDDEGSDEMPSMKIAFNDAGGIEYFEMAMDGMGEELTVMKMYVLTETRVNSLFTDLDAGTLVALPFSVSGDMDHDEMFMCNDGEMIPMDYVNDGWDDCDGGEDEMDMGGSDDEFICDDGETIPMDYVNDGYEDCTNGEDEDGETQGGDEEMTLDDFGISSWDSTNDLQEIIDWFNDNYNYGDGEPMLTVDDFLADCNADANSVDVYVAECIFNAASEMLGMYDDSDDDAPSPADLLSLADSDSDGELTPEEFFAFLEMDEGCCLPDEMKSDINDIMNNSDSDSSGTLSESELETFIMDFVSYQNSMEGGEDDGDMDDDNGGEDSPSPQELLDMTDTDSNGAMTMDEFNAYMNQDGETMPQEMIDEFNLIFDEADSDDSGDLDIDELEQFIIDIDDYMMSMEDSEEMFTCDNGETIPMSWVDDGMDDCSDGSDETDMHDGHDEGGHGHGDEDDEIVMYITSEMDFHFEGDMSDYKIELASCDYDYDMDTGEEMKTCTTVMSVAINDAGMDSDIMFHDADSSGTISVGDMIHIGETDVEWDEVRLYSISADAYSDENPMHNAPGFTGLVGMLALLGAAFIRRNE